ncbi:kelch-like protein 23 [Syngnathoides biaculeatus]|uniref:kelch-like protein 23 n=1 Tax=Syngnathoides biaculeatus TaxID=300417 RepID=UPI002ADE05E7|nr:kelch-like protein 23 [Syngnathoides biaculeatus]
MACRSSSVLSELTNQLKDNNSILQPDVMLQVDGESFHVNRHQLALQSPYFRALFFACGVESTKRKIELQGIRLQHFKVLMDHSRTSILPLDRENVVGILETADFLHLERAKILCCKFLERELHLCNCLGMMTFAWQRGCAQLYSAARQVALTHFSAVVSEEEFMSLSKETLAHLIASDNLVIHSEDLALEAALCWVSFDKKREEHFLDLIELVRPECLSLTFISKLLETMTHNSDPRAKLIRILNEHFPTSWSMGRSLKRTKETLFVMGGPHDQEQQASHQFHPLSWRWQNCPPLQRRNLTQYSVAAVGDSVVVTGGYFRDVLWYSVDWVRKYEFRSQTWVDCPALQKSRHSHCSVALESILYVLGGSMDEGLVADVERLRLGSDGGWESVSPMSRAVERAAVATLGQCIYVACGLDENGEAFGGIQRYDTIENHWDIVSYSPFPRYDLVATELNGAIYLFGGQALRLDVETDEWTVLHEESLEKKFFCGCTTVCGQIFLLCEKKGNKALPNMVLFDPYVDTCINVYDNIPCTVPLRGCVTIKVLS